VVITLAEPWRFISFFMKVSAAALSRSFVAKDSSTSPS
jgi:hypothetical protein